MTDSEKLDILLENLISLDQNVISLDQKVTTLDQKITGLEKDMNDVKAVLRRLHRDDTLILDEVERVHEILNAQKSDKTAHTA